MLSHQEFYSVLKNTPLVAVDFLIFDFNGNILLGKRLNNPAKSFFFSFGNIIFKNEKITEAQERVLRNELKINQIEKYMSKIRFNGVFEQFYSNNFMDEQTSTHYVVLSYALTIDKHDIEIIPGNDMYTNQHENLKWFNESNVYSSDEVHPHAKQMLTNFKTNY